MALAGNLRWPRDGQPGIDLITLAGEGEILFGDSPFIMRGERQRHLVKTDVNVRMMIVFLSLFGDPPHKGDAGHESIKLKSAADGFRAFRPIRHGFQAEVNVFGGQGWHNGNINSGSGRSRFSGRRR